MSAGVAKCRTRCQAQSRSPQVGEVGGEARVRGVEVLADLRPQGRGLADELAAVTDQELKRRPRFVPARLDQREAADGGAVDRRQVGVIGLVAGVGGLAKLFGGERMDDAGLEAGGREGVLNGAMVTAVRSTATNRSVRS